MNEMREYIKSNNLMLTKSQIETLKKYNINYEQNVKMILYEIDQILNDDYYEVLDEIGNVIAQVLILPFSSLPYLIFPSSSSLLATDLFSSLKDG